MDYKIYFFKNLSLIVSPVFRISQLFPKFIPSAKNTFLFWIGNTETDWNAVIKSVLGS